MVWAERKSVDRVAAGLVAQADRARRRGNTEEHRAAMIRAARHLEHGGRPDAAVDLFLSVREYAFAADVAEAARDYERAAQIWFRQGNFERAAKAHCLGGSLERAAEIYVQIGNLSRAARLLVRRGAPLKAARLFERAGEPLRAAQCFVAAIKNEKNGVEKARLTRSAAACYEKAGEIERAARILELNEQRANAADLLERHGRGDAAARIREDSQVLHGAEVMLAGARAGDPELYDRAIQLLASVSEDNRLYLRARVMLAEILVERDDEPCALRVLRRLLAGGRFDRKHLPALHLYGKLLVKAGRVGEARGTFRTVVDIDPGYEDAAQRLDRLGETGEISSVVPQSLAASMAPDAGVSHPPLLGMTLRDRFRLDRRLGGGAQAEVFAAHDLVLDRSVAIKVLDRELALDPRASEAFVMEARYAARVHHRACLDVYDFGVDQGVIFMAMELLEGHSLGDAMAGRRMSVEKMLAIATEVAAALTAVHDVGLVHRDVKPTNILIDESGRVCLADFGVATSLDGAGSLETAAGAGTLKYMAPEQADPNVVDARSDVYALGIVMFEMLAGHAPFEATVASLVDRLLQPPPALPFEGLVSANLAAIVRRCLEPDPDDRWPSMRALRDALLRAASPRY